RWTSIQTNPRFWTGPMAAGVAERMNDVGQPQVATAGGEFDNCVALSTRQQDMNRAPGRETSILQQIGKFPPGQVGRQRERRYRD
ncbi:unnamed protein product, partial [Ectocarpus sp. 12 AP-2014]